MKGDFPLHWAILVNKMSQVKLLFHNSVNTYKPVPHNYLTVRTFWFDKVSL